MKKITAMLIVYLALFSVCHIDGYCKDSDPTPTEIEFRPVDTRDDPKRHPRMPAYIPLNGYILDGIFTIRGSVEGNATIEIADIEGNIYVYDVFDMVSGYTIRISDYSSGTFIYVTFNGINYIAQIQ